MRAIPFLFAVTVIASPQSVTAADVAISCALTKEEILFIDRTSPEGIAVHKDITETVDFTISDSALVTPMGSPCDRIVGVTTGANLDVSCSFPPDRDSQASIKIRINRQVGTISETWEIVEDDGSQSHFHKDGTCVKRQGFYLTAND
jgi:hypothetical protein